MFRLVTFTTLIISVAGIKAVHSGVQGLRNDSPVQKVVSMLGDLEMKIKRDGEAEMKAYATYMDWCKNGGKDKEFEIKTAKSEIEDLTATISKADADLSALSTKIEELAADMSTNEADLKAATGIREKENAEFVAAEKELTETIDTLERAINILERKMHGSALLQEHVNTKDIRQLVRVMSTLIDAASLSLHDKKMLLGLVQSGQEDQDGDMLSDPGAPDPAAYQEHSRSIVDVLEDLKQKAMTQLEEARREEQTARHNFDLLKQSLEDQIKYDNKEFTQSKMAKHEATEVKATSQADLDVTKKDLADAEIVLKNMDNDCRTKAEEHNISVKNRADELKALAEAKKAILSMTGGAEDVVYTSASFVQISGSKESSASLVRTRSDLVNFEVVNFVRKLAREQKSAALAQLVGKINAAMRASVGTGADPFAKVKALISNMIEELTKAAGEEANHKAYCDKEFGETGQKIDELQHDVEGYSSKLEKLKSESMNLKDEVATLQKEIGETIRTQADADKMRQDEYKIYVQTKSDLEQGLSGVRMALKILRDYYASDSEAASLAQQPPDAPVEHSKSDAGSGIISMLEVIESDFGKSLANTEMTEEQAATAYEKLSMENKMSNAMKTQDVQFKSKEATSLDKATTELASDLDSTQSELDAVMEYSQKIRAMCEVKPETYEEKKARSDAEIAGLKEALQILEGQAVFLQRPRRHLGLRGAAVAYKQL